MLTGIVTYVAWFGKDYRACKEILYSKLKEEISIQKMCEALDATKDFLYPLHTPEAIEEFIKIPKEFDTWNWWYLIARKDEEEQRKLQDQWWEFLNRIRSKRELILYAQRNFLMGV